MKIQEGGKDGAVAAEATPKRKDKMATCEHKDFEAAVAAGRRPGTSQTNGSILTM